MATWYHPSYFSYRCCYFLRLQLFDRSAAIVKCPHCDQNTSKETRPRNPSSLLPFPVLTRGSSFMPRIIQQLNPTMKFLDYMWYLQWLQQKMHPQKVYNWIDTRGLPPAVPPMISSSKELNWCFSNPTGCNALDDPHCSCPYTIDALIAS